MDAKTKQKIEHILRTAQPLDDRVFKRIERLAAAAKTKR